MDYLVIALIALVIEIMLIIMIFSVLYLRRNASLDSNSTDTSLRQKLSCIDHPKCKEYLSLLHKYLDNLQIKFDKAAIKLGVKYSISECPPNAHALITCLHCHYDYILSEISVLELGEISLNKLDKHEKDVTRIIAEFNAIEKSIDMNDGSNSEYVIQIKKLQDKLKKSESIEGNENGFKSYLYELKKENIVNKKENKGFKQQIEIFKERVQELEKSKEDTNTSLEDVSSQMNGILEKEKEELEESLHQANERITDLQAYKVRFDELQTQVSSETGANIELRQDLRSKVEGTDSEDEIDNLIAEYETVRISLDDFMERPDIAPMAGISRAENDEKIAEMNEAIDNFAKECCVVMKQDTFQLAELNSSESDTVKQLQQELQEVTIDKNKLEQNLNSLEQSINNKGKIISNLEKSISEKQTDIEQLQQKMHQVSAKNASISDLELTVERFSRQSMTMMQQIMDLEEENAKLKG